MAVCIIDLRRDFDDQEQLLKQLQRELKVAGKLHMKAVKILHAPGARAAQDRHCCRQYLYEALRSGEIRAFCPGECFGPFEAQGKHIAYMYPELKRDRDWSKYSRLCSLVLV